LSEVDWSKEPARPLQVRAEFTASRISSMTPAAHTLAKQLLTDDRRSSKVKVANTVEESD
jgi:hypothetical protein